MNEDLKTATYQDGWDYAELSHIDGLKYDPWFEPGHLSDGDREQYIEGYEAYWAAHQPNTKEPG